MVTSLVDLRYEALGRGLVARPSVDGLDWEFWVGGYVSPKTCVKVPGNVVQAIMRFGRVEALLDDIVAQVGGAG